MFGDPLSPNANYESFHMHLIIKINIVTTIKRDGVSAAYRFISPIYSSNYLGA